MKLVRIQGAYMLVVIAGITAACGGSPVAPAPGSEGPVVHSITPSIGATSGGTEVTIRGLRFAAGASVTIGGQAASDVNVQGSEALVAKTPPGAVGTAAVVVTVNGRSGTLPSGFSYQVPPNNALPVVASIAARGRRPAQPEDFADLGETLRVSATVRDDETAADQLEYHWSATAGSIIGTGASVDWQAPAAANPTPLQVTITLRVVERYGVGGVFRHEVTSTHAVAVHDSVREIGGMARRFLEEFSKPQTNTHWRDVMRDFSEALCPDPRHVDAERGDVERHIANFFMHGYTIGPASVGISFGSGCVFIGNRFRPGDACASVPTNWDSTNKQNGVRATTIGIDHLSAVYSRAGSRWWLCSSDFEPTGTVGHSSYSKR